MPPSGIIYFFSSTNNNLKYGEKYKYHFSIN